MDSLVKCTGCGQFRSKSNLARHQKSCVAAADKGDMTSHEGQVFCSPLARSRSASKESGVHSRSPQDSSPMAYAPTGLSMMMNSVILDAVNALLDQHSIYTQKGLEAYLARHYPEIPEYFRAPVVLAATAGARQAALMHHVWEKNVGSPDQGKRQFATGAASSLSFWALGMLPVHRSGNVYQPREARTSLELPQRVEPSCQSEVMVPVAVDGHMATGCQEKTLTLADVVFPVSLESRDEEFEELMMAQNSTLQLPGHELFLELPAAISPIHVEQQPADGPSLTASDVVRGANTQDNPVGLQQADAVEVGAQRPPPSDQRSDVGVSQPTQQQGDGKEGSQLQTELGSTPVLVIHVASDIESDGDEIRRATSVVTVRAAGETKVSAEATLKPSVGNSKSAQPVRQTTTDWGHKDRKRDSPHQRRAWSPHRKQSRGRSDDFSRRPPATYMVDAEEYRRFQDFMRQPRGFRYRK